MLIPQGNWKGSVFWDKIHRSYQRLHHEEIHNRKCHQPSGSVQGKGETQERLRHNCDIYKEFSVKVTFIFTFSECHYGERSRDSKYFNIHSVWNTKYIKSTFFLILRNSVLICDLAPWVTWPLWHRKSVSFTILRVVWYWMSGMYLGVIPGFCEGFYNYFYVDCCG